MRAILIALALLTLVACGSSNDTDNGQPNEAFTPRNQEVQNLTIVDAAGNEISGAEVTIVEVTPQPNNLVVSESIELDILVSDENGNIQVSSLAPGLYSVSVSLEGVTVEFLVRIEEGNALSSATVLVPMSVIELDGGEIEVVSLIDEGIFFSLSGLVYDENGPISGAQVSLSGGAETNGAINTVLTNEDGHFSLVINVGLYLEEALELSTIRIVKEGYDPIDIVNYNAVSVTSISGLNVQLSEQQSDTQAIYLETFDTKSELAVCGNWISDSENTLWHEHGSSLGILNQAFSSNLVVLAPNDTSAGYVPDPYSGYACWYGEAAAGGINQGNFLGGLGESNGGEELSGGTSLVSNYGAITSPEIDLSDVSAPISLHFKTWWEIESVNPNDDGFDIMSIQYSDDEGETWKTIARLNPLTDPVDGFSSDDERAPFPYSNNGFNRAPGWIIQEPIPLDELANKVVRLRFEFNTEDELFNGFRGWLIDDIAIYPTQGTFPLYEESFSESDSEMIICEAPDEQDMVDEFEDGVAPVDCPSTLE